MSRPALATFDLAALRANYAHARAVHGGRALAVLKANVDKAQRLVARLARDFPREHPACPLGSDRALEHAIISPPEARDPALVAKLDAVAGRVLRPHG